MEKRRVSLSSPNPELPDHMSSPNLELLDHISDLPNRILLSILDLLPVRCAVQTSILSRRWKYLWTFTSNIILHEDQIMPGDHANDSKFARFVNGFFRFHKQPIVKRISFCFCPTGQLPSHIEEWIKLAMSRKIEELQVRFTYDLEKRETTQFAFGSLKPSPCTAFSSLKILCLQCLDISDEMLQGLLSAFKVIESIKLISCDTLTNLRVMSAPASLKRFTVKNCPLLDEIEIRAPNLLSFEFKGDRPIRIFHTCLPSLLDATFVYDYTLIDKSGIFKKGIQGVSSLIKDIAHVKSLTISVLFFEYMITGSNSSDWLQHTPFINLEELQILGCNANECSFRVIDFLICYSTHLKKLILDDIGTHVTSPKLEEGGSNAWVPPICLVDNVKTIKIAWFDGCNEGVELIKFLLKSSEVLESMIIEFSPKILARENGKEVMKNADKFLGTCYKLLTFPRASRDARIIVALSSCKEGEYCCLF